jgi:hypothetical protein
LDTEEGGLVPLNLGSASQKRPAQDLSDQITSGRAPDERWSIDSDTPVGRLHHLGPTVRLSQTPPYWARPSVPLGYNEPVWPARSSVRFYSKRVAVEVAQPVLTN